MAIKFVSKTSEITLKDEAGNQSKVSFPYQFLVSNDEARPTLEELNSEFQSLSLDLAETLRGAINDSLKMSAQDRAVSIAKLSKNPDSAKKDLQESLERMVLAGIMTREQADAALAAIA